MVYLTGPTGIVTLDAVCEKKQLCAFIVCEKCKKGNYFNHMLSHTCTDFGFKRVVGGEDISFLSSCYGFFTKLV